MTNPTQLIEQLVAALEHAIKWLNICDKPRECLLLHEALSAARAHLEQPTEPAPSKDKVLVGEDVADFGEIARLARLYLDSEYGKYSARSVLTRILCCALAEPAPSTAGERPCHTCKHSDSWGQPDCTTTARINCGAEKKLWEPLTTGKYSDLVSDGGMDPRNSAHGITQAPKGGK